MDKNKLKVLQEIGYSIKRTCRSCDHSLISRKDCWGLCLKYKYDHLKHSENDSWLSVHENGYCKSYKTPDYDVLNLGGFNEFVEVV